MGPRRAGDPPQYSSKPPRPPDPGNLRMKLQVELEETAAGFRELHKSMASMVTEQAVFQSEILLELRQFRLERTAQLRPPSPPPQAMADPYHYRQQQPPKYSPTSLPLFPVPKPQHTPLQLQSFTSQPQQPLNQHHMDPFVTPPPLAQFTASPLPLLDDASPPIQPPKIHSSRLQISFPSPARTTTKPPPLLDGAVSAQSNSPPASFCSVSGTNTSVSNQFNCHKDDCGGMGFVFGANVIVEKLENGESVEKRAEVNGGLGRELSEPECVIDKQDEGEDKEQVSNGMSEFHAPHLFDKMPKSNEWCNAGSGSSRSGKGLLQSQGYIPLSVPLPVTSASNFTPSISQPVSTRMYNERPKLSLSKSIGNGVEFLNRHLSAKLFHDKESMHPLLEFLRVHCYKGKNMMLNDRIQNVNALQHVLRKAEELLATLAPETLYKSFEIKLQDLGLERGWGDNVERVLEMIQFLLELLEAPDPCNLEKFLGRIPMVYNVVIMSIHDHGYFAQDNVLGYPDTGGQVVYILDQVCALENERLKSIKKQGLDIIPRILVITRLLTDAVGTSCGQRLEKVYNTKHSDILRVPFRTENGIVRKWISRFKVWPYLETYTEDVATELAKELFDSVALAALLKVATSDAVLDGNKLENQVPPLVPYVIPQMHANLVNPNFQSISSVLINYALPKCCRYGKDIGIGSVVNVFNAMRVRLKHYIEGSKKTSHYVLQLCFSGFDKKVRDKGGGHTLLTDELSIPNRKFVGNMRLIWVDFSVLKAVVVENSNDLDAPVNDVLNEVLLFLNKRPESSANVQSPSSQPTAAESKEQSKELIHQQVDKEVEVELFPAARFFDVEKLQTPCSCVIRTIESRASVIGDDLKNVVSKIRASEREGINSPWDEEHIPKEIVSMKPNPRSTVQQYEYSNIGATELILSNGMRVCYKSTNFLDDQVIITGFSYGCLFELVESECFSCLTGPTIAGEIGVYGYRPSVLMDKLARKRAEVSTKLGVYMRTFNDNSNNTDQTKFTSWPYVDSRYCSPSAISIVTIHFVALVKCFTALGVMETTKNTHTNKFAEKAKGKLLDIIFGFDEEKLQKLAPKYFGPFQVIKKIGKVAYKLLLPPTAKIHPVHVSRLKKKVGSTVITSPDLPPMFESDKAKWYPSKIIDRGIFKKNNAAVTKWLVRWKNTNEEDATWEDPEQFMNRFPEFQSGIASLIFKRGGMLGHPSKSCDRAWPKSITVGDILHSYLVCDLCQL